MMAHADYKEMLPAHALSALDALSFGEADYEYTSYEYVDVAGGTARDTHNGFLAGAGYALPVADNVGIYFSALYDFTYDSNGTYSTYESPVRFQVGVSVGF